MQKRFEDALKKLTADLEMKLAQREELKEQLLLRKEGLEAEDVDTDAEATGQEVEASQEERDLFGDENQMDMD